MVASIRSRSSTVFFKRSSRVKTIAIESISFWCLANASNRCCSSDRFLAVVSSADLFSRNCFSSRSNASTASRACLPASSPCFRKASNSTFRWRANVKRGINSCCRRLA